MRSMTGFGIGQALLEGSRLSLELRGFNHRHLDVRVRVPPELLDHAFFLEQAARERLSRGRFDVGVRLSGAGSAPELDIERARKWYLDLLRLRDAVAPEADVPLSLLGDIPDLFSTASHVDFEAARESLVSALEMAVERLGEMRSVEGEALKRELDKRSSTLRALHRSIRQKAEHLVDQYRAKLEARLARLLADRNVPLDPGRMEHETALLADKSDIEEELVRLESHFDQFNTLLSSTGGVGRRLDFLLQEMSREVNTIGAKAQDAAVSHLVVEMKSELERVREQVQNVE